MHVRNWSKFSLFCLSLVITGCTLFTASDNPVLQPLPPIVNTGATITRFDTESRTLIENEQFDITVQILPEQPITGQLTTIAINVEQNGKPVDLEASSRLMQATLTSSNTYDLDHFLLETPNEEGLYTIDYILTQTGTYALWIDVNANNIPDHHGDNTNYRSVTFLTATGSQIDGYTQVREPRTSTEFAGYTFTLNPVTQTASTLTTLELSGTDGRGVPVEFVLNDPFYVIAEPKTGMYDLEHFHLNSSNESLLKTQEIGFLEPGLHAVWTFLYVQEPDDRVRIVNPRFLLDIQPKPHTIESGLNTL